MVICDTNIFIEYFKNNPEIISAIESFGINNAALSHITAAELYFGALNKKELGQIKKVIDKFILLSVTSEISDTFSDLIYEYSLSNKIGIPDAMIAATAIAHDCELYTLNKRDFVFIKGLRLINP